MRINARAITRHHIYRPMLRSSFIGIRPRTCDHDGMVLGHGIRSRAARLVDTFIFDAQMLWPGTQAYLA